MEFVPFKACCTARILIGFGESANQGYDAGLAYGYHQRLTTEGKIKWLQKELEEMERVGDVGHVISMLTSAQKEGKIILEACGFVNAAAGKNKKHRETTLTCWVKTIDSRKKKAVAPPANAFAPVAPPVNAGVANDDVIRDLVGTVDDPRWLKRFIFARDEALREGSSKLTFKANGHNLNAIQIATPSTDMARGGIHEEAFRLNRRFSHKWVVSTGLNNPFEFLTKSSKIQVLVRSAGPGTVQRFSGTAEEMRKVVCRHPFRNQLHAFRLVGV